MKGGEAGLLAIYYREASMRPVFSPGATGYPPLGTDMGVTGNVYVLQPYTIVNIGPVKLQAN